MNKLITLTLSVLTLALPGQALAAASWSGTPRHSRVAVKFHQHARPAHLAVNLRKVK